MRVRIIFSVILVALFIVACEKTVTTDKIAYYEKEDILVVKNSENKPFTGTLQHYDKKGILQYETQVKKGKILDLYLELDDLSALYSADYQEYDDFDQLFDDTTKVLLKDANIPFYGKVILTNQKDIKSEFIDKTILNFNNGLKQGEILIYDNDNNIMKRYYLSEGKIQYLEINLYREDGTIYAKTQYEDNKRNGETIFYARNGNIETKSNYVDDVLQGQSITYYEDGNVCSKYNYVDGQLQGQSIIYFEDGSINVRKNYSDDKLHGERLEYYRNGNLMIKSNYLNGELQGKNIIYKKNGEIDNRNEIELIQYYDNGKVMSKTTYINGKKNGESLTYQKNGNISYKTNFVDGKEHGESIIYNEDGSIYQKYNYVNGEIKD